MFYLTIYLNQWSSALKQHKILVTHNTEALSENDWYNLVHPLCISAWREEAAFQWHAFVVYFSTFLTQKYLIGQKTLGSSAILFSDILYRKSFFHPVWKYVFTYNCFILLKTNESKHMTCLNWVCCCVVVLKQSP